MQSVDSKRIKTGFDISALRNSVQNPAPLPASPSPLKIKLLLDKLNGEDYVDFFKWAR